MSGFLLVRRHSKRFRLRSNQTRTKGYAFSLLKTPQRKRKTQEKSFCDFVTSYSHQAKPIRKERKSKQLDKVDGNNSKQLTSSISESIPVSPMLKVKKKGRSKMYPGKERSINFTDDNRRKTHLSYESVNVNSLHEKKLSKQPQKSKERKILRKVTNTKKEISSASELCTSSLLQSTGKGNKFRQQMKSDLPQNIIIKDSKRVTRSSFVGIPNTSLKKGPPTGYGKKKKPKTVESNEPNTAIVNKSNRVTRSVVESDLAASLVEATEKKSMTRKCLEVKRPVSSNSTRTGRKCTITELIPVTPGIEIVEKSKIGKDLGVKQTVNSVIARGKRKCAISESIPVTPVFKVGNKSKSLPSWDIISSMNDNEHITSLRQRRTKNKPQPCPERKKSGRTTRETDLDTSACVQLPFATPLSKDIGKGVKSFKKVMRNIPIDSIITTSAVRPSASRLLTKDFSNIFNSPLNNSREESEHRSVEVKLKSKSLEGSGTELFDGNKDDNSRNRRTKGIKRGSQHSQETENSKRKKKISKITPVITSDNICPLGSSDTSFWKNNKKSRKCTDNLKSKSINKSKDSTSISFSTPDLTKISIDELGSSSSFVNCLSLPAAVKRKFAAKRKMPGSLPNINRGPKVQGKDKIIKSGSGLTNSVPKKGTLKRKRWVLNTLKEKNEGYEDDIFESQKFKTLVMKMPTEYDEESDVSSTSISTPKCGFFLTPAVPKKTPKYKDCISPSELLLARKSAEEYLYRRNKKRTSGRNVSQMPPPPEEKSDNLPEKKKLKFAEVMGKLSTIQTDFEKNNEDQSEEEDAYFSDVSV